LRGLSLTACDATYIALAERLGLPLLTDDGKLAAARVTPPKCIRTRT
jgi:predicted nucleic acid-binding protein